MISCMGKPYSNSTIWEKTIIIVLHIYGDRSLFLIFLDQQDTESES